MLVLKSSPSRSRYGEARIWGRFRSSYAVPEALAKNLLSILNSQFTILNTKD